MINKTKGARETLSRPRDTWHIQSLRLSAQRSRVLGPASYSSMSSSREVHEPSQQEFDFWDYVSCSLCYLLFTPNDKGPPPVPFWLTECGHVLCNNHLRQWYLFLFTSSFPFGLCHAHRPGSKLCSMRGAGYPTGASPARCMHRLTLPKP